MPAILIVDERHALRTALDVLLSSDDQRVLCTGTPEEGLQMLAAERVDLVVLQVEYADEEMPGETSIAFVRAARISHPALPIVVLAADGHPALQELTAIDGIEHVAIPWDNEHLRYLVGLLLARSTGAHDHIEPSRSDIERALLYTRGVLSRAARQLGMSKDDLCDRMRKLRLMS